MIDTNFNVRSQRMQYKFHSCHYLKFLAPWPNGKALLSGSV